jgi:hypothetical protein
MQNRTAEPSLNISHAVVWHVVNIHDIITPIHVTRPLHLRSNRPEFRNKYSNWRPMTGEQETQT